jgi:hypothetical protein
MGLGMSHLAFGWVIFGVSIFASFAVGVRWRDELPAVRPLQIAGRPAMSVLAAGALAAAIPLVGIFLRRKLKPRRLPRHRCSALNRFPHWSRIVLPRAVSVRVFQVPALFIR